MKIRPIITSLALTGVLSAMGVSTQTAWASDAYPSSPLTATFGLGGSVSATINERSGQPTIYIPLASLPGLDGGEVDLGVAYRHDLAATQTDRNQIGSGWVWEQSFIDVDGDDEIVVSLATGGSYGADETQPTGLTQYLLDDVFFSQKPGTLPTRDDVSSNDYAYSLSYNGGITEYFTEDGDLRTRVDAFGKRVDAIWGSSHQLLALIDAAGNRISLDWADDSVTVLSPERSDGVQPQARLTMPNGFLGTVTTAANESESFVYRNDNHLLENIRTSSGATTHVSYQPLADNALALDRITVSDNSGTELLQRFWKTVGSHTWMGTPTYTSDTSLWASKDNEYRYTTELSNGPTRIASDFNSLGLMIAQRTTVSSSSGDYVAQEQILAYPGTEAGGVPQVLHENYGKPVEKATTHKNMSGNTRTVAEKFDYDSAGRLTRHVAADGTTTTTSYDTTIPEGLFRPVGLVLDETVTGFDGQIQRTINTPRADHKAIAVTTNWSGATDSPLELLTTTSTATENDGFVTEQTTTYNSRPENGPSETTQRYVRTIGNGTVAYSHIAAAGTTAESTTSRVIDTASGLTLSETDQAGRVSTSHYDEADRVTTQTDSLGRITTTSYESGVTTVKEPSGLTTRNIVDALGRVVKTTNNVRDGQAVPGVEHTTQSVRYDDGGARVTLTDGYGRETVTTMDAFGRTTRVDEPSGITRLTSYDDAANTVTTGAVIDGARTLAEAPVTTTSEKNNSGHVVRESGTRADGVAVPESLSRYDSRGRTPETQTDDLRSAIEYNNDGTPRKTTLTPANTEIFPGSRVTAEREHTPSGAATKKSLVAEGTTAEGITLTHDAAGRVVAETNQLGQTKRFDYSLDGLVTRVLDEASQTETVNDYDRESRALVHAVTTRPGSETIETAYAYDGVTDKVTVVFDPRDPVNTRIDYSYDVLSNVTQVRYPDGNVVTHRYDDEGRKASTTDIAGLTTTYRYDNAGQLIGATQVDESESLVARVEYTRDGWGRVAVLHRDNGVTTRYTYSSTDEIATEITTQGGAVLHEGQYEYDSHGNLLTRVDSHMEDSREVTKTTRHSYNAYNQLVGTRIFDGDPQLGQLTAETSYGVTIDGHVVNETSVHNGVTTVREFTINELGQTTAITTDGVTAIQDYDSSGNLTRAADGTVSQFNALNQPTLETFPDGTVTTHSYWATGQRRSLAEVSSTIHDDVALYWDGDTLINEKHSDTNSVSYLVGTDHQARTVTRSAASEPSTSYYVSDRHGNTVATTDRNGNASTRYSYNDYGVLATRTEDAADSTSSERNPLLYAGEYTQTNGHQLLGKRTYAPENLAFTTRDSADLFNLYAYANANPITLIDPTGRTAKEDGKTPTMDFLNETWFKAVAFGIGVFVLGGIFRSYYKAARLNSGTFTDPKAARVANIADWVGILGVTIDAISTAFGLVDLIDHGIKKVKQDKATRDGTVAPQEGFIPTHVSQPLYAASLIIGWSAGIAGVFGRNYKIKAMERQEKINKRKSPTFLQDAPEDDLRKTIAALELKNESLQDQIKAFTGSETITAV